MSRAPAKGRGGIGLGQIFTTTVGTIIGIGWITMLGIWLEQAGPLGAILAFTGGAIIILPIALCYAEMAAAIPERGGEIAYVRPVLGQRGALVAGWLLLLTFVAVMVFEAVSTAWVLGAMFPALAGNSSVDLGALTIRPIELATGLLGLALITAINLSGGRGFGRVQDLTTYGKLGVSAIFIIAGIVWGDPANLEPLIAMPSDLPAWGGILAVLVTTPFWFSGFNAAAQAIGERASGTSLHGFGAVLAAAIGVSLLFYCLVIAAASMAAPREVILGHSLPAAGAFAVTFGPLLGKAVLTAGLLGLISTWNAVYFAGSRVLAALAEAGALPQILARRNAAGAPISAMIACTFLGAVGTLFGRGVIGPIVNATGTCVAALFVMVCWSMLVLRRGDPEMVRPFRAPGGSVTASVACVASFVIVVLSLYLPYVERGSPPPEWLILGAWLSVGAVLLFSRRRYLISPPTA